MTAEQPKYTVHQGDDYLEITGPTRMVLTARYPDNEDRDEAEEMVKQLTAAPELLTALEALLKEVEAAGNANADDYGWPTVVPQARAAIAMVRKP